MRQSAAASLLRTRISRGRGILRPMRCEGVLHSMSPAEPPCEGLPARPLRRLSVELIVLIMAKIALLALLWWIAFAPHPKPDSSPAAIERLLAPAAMPAQGARP